MSSEIITIIEEKIIKLRNRISKKGVLASKKEKELLEKYEELLLEQYKKIEQFN